MVFHILKINNNWTAFTLAAREDHNKITKFLVKYGADVNVQDKCDRTPLTIAIRES
ncbi:ankyrin repeat domain-containing protein [Candidatus Xenohaliotis californiensis]|uniref:ankyrin repeat domain-containing protein n=1 Tax=Candidatus Xenohaliotis californiensis TaxID=84677 RepID=UPI003977AC5B